MENVTALSVYDKFKQELAVFKAADAELVFDIETPKGEADCRAYHVKLRKVWNGVNDLRLDTSKEFRQKVKDINTDGIAILAEIDAIANPRKALLAAKEARLQKEIDDLAEANRLKAEADEDERLAYIENQEFDNAKIAADLKAQQDAIDKEKADLEAAKQAEAKKVAAVAEAKRQAAQDAKDAAAQAERNQKAAVEETERKAKAEADRKAKEIADKYAAEQAKKELAAKVEADRVADVEHRKEIEQSIIDGMSDIISPMEAQAIVDAISCDQIPNLTIQY